MLTLASFFAAAPAALGEEAGVPLISGRHPGAESSWIAPVVFVYQGVAVHPFQTGRTQSGLAVCPAFAWPVQSLSPGRLWNFDDVFRLCISLSTNTQLIDES